MVQDMRSTNYDRWQSLGWALAFSVSLAAFRIIKIEAGWRYHLWSAICRS